MDDFPQQNSSDEEQSVRTRLKRVVPSPRKSNQPKNSKSFNKNEPVIPASGGGQTPGNSQSRCCINRKSLREITSEELVELRSSMVCFDIFIFNHPLNPLDASKHHFATRKNDLTSYT